MNRKHNVVIAERDFEIRNKAAGEASSLHLIIYAPVKNENDWSCSYELGGATKEIIGIDSLQSLKLCLQVVENDLKRFSKEFEISFLGQDNNWL